MTNSQSTIDDSQSATATLPPPLPIQPEERDVLEPRARPSLLEWMQSSYLLEGGTAAIEGTWSSEYTPYFVPIAGWFSDTTTREIWVYACSQSGKTTFGTGAVGWITDVAAAPTLLIMPTKDDVRNRVEARIRPMFRSNPDLLAHVNGRVRNIHIGKQTVMDHMNLYIGWPTTPQALADKPVCYIIPDETGKYPPFVGEEADPISLMRKRQRWFKTRSKLLGMTTPVTAGDMSDEQFNRGDRCQWWVPCPHCDKWHQLDWEHVEIDRKTGPDGKPQFYAEERYRKGKLSRYVCPKCAALWSEDDRWRAVCGGRFVPGDCELDDSGRLVGETGPRSYRSCRIHALMLHPMVETVASLTAEFAAAQKAKRMGNIQPLKDFWNSQLARPWREERASTDIDKLRTHLGGYQKGQVPPGVEMITAGLDVQLDHVYIRVIGFGYLGENWSLFEQRIETGPTDRVENLEKLLPFLTMRLPLMTNPDMTAAIAVSAIDRNYNPETVDAFCVRCMGVVSIIPVMGDDKVRKQQYRVGKAAGGQLKRFDLNVTSYKDSLFRSYFESTEPGPGYGHLHAATEHVVLEHLTSEKKTIERKGTRITWVGWVVKTEGRANHYWDCTVYARAAAEIAGLWAIRPPQPAKPKVGKRTRPGGSGFLDGLPGVWQ